MRLQSKATSVKQLKIGNEEDVEKAKRIKLDLGKICSRASQQKTIDKEIVLLESRFIDALLIRLMEQQD